MKKYAFDTSGISNPLESMPEDIHESMWGNFKTKILPSGIIAVTQEIYDEMGSIPGSVGEMTCHRSFIQQHLESEWVVRRLARVEQRASGGAGRGCAADRPL